MDLIHKPHCIHSLEAHVERVTHEFWLTLLGAGVLEHIQDKWDVMIKDDCLPVHVALQLMDHSSLGRGGDYQDFQKTNKQLQKALKAIVNGILRTKRVSKTFAEHIQSTIRVLIALSAPFTASNQVYRLRRPACGF